MGHFFCTCKHLKRKGKSAILNASEWEIVEKSGEKWKSGSR